MDYIQTIVHRKNGLCTNKPSGPFSIPCVILIIHSISLLISKIINNCLFFMKITLKAVITVFKR